MENKRVSKYAGQQPMTCATGAVVVDAAASEWGISLFYPAWKEYAWLFRWYEFGLCGLHFLCV